MLNDSSRLSQETADRLLAGKPVCLPVGVKIQASTPWQVGIEQYIREAETARNGLIDILHSPYPADDREQIEKMADSIDRHVAELRKMMREQRKEPSVTSRDDGLSAAELFEL